MSSDTQRDLAFAMFCGGSESENRSGETGESSHVNEWSIPGAHAPVAAMIHSWLVRGLFPCHYVSLSLYSTFAFYAFVYL